MLMKDIMTCVPFLHSTVKLGQAVQHLRRSKLDALPVVDEDGFLLGLFTKINVLDAFLIGAEPSESIQKYYSQQALTAESSSPYGEIEDRLQQCLIGTGVVVDREGRALGIFTKSEMMMALLQETEHRATESDSVLNALPLGIIVVDNKNQIQKINPAGEKLLNITEPALKGTMPSSIFSGLDLSQVLEASQGRVGVHTLSNNADKVFWIMSQVGETGAVIVIQDFKVLEQDAYIFFT